MLGVPTWVLVDEGRGDGVETEIETEIQPFGLVPGYSLLYSRMRGEAGGCMVTVTVTVTVRETGDVLRGC